MTNLSRRLLVVLALLSGGCGGPIRSEASRVTLSDPQATPETRALFTNLQRLAREHVLFGHQDDLAYGVEWLNEPGRSDVKEVAGSYPAVYGWDLGRLELESSANLDDVEFDRMRRWIIEGYERGGVITVSWHVDNPVSGGNSWDTTRAVPAILPGGPRHEQYRQWLDRVAAFFGSLHAGGGELVPLVFRPFHEMNGSWFWWGGRHTTGEEYQRLWRFTVEYLRDEKSVHNLLWAYSTNSLGDFERPQYWTWYPGDDYVDVLGFDDYFTLPGGPGREDPVGTMTEYLKWLVEQAEARGKISALTETGYERIPEPAWWTGKLLAAIKGDAVARRIAWVLVWRNANRTTDRPDHYYAPYPGHPSAADFVEFRGDPLILFEDDLPQLYRSPR
jgi:mannan endo-1,4-beta-mannosidase